MTKQIEDLLNEDTENAVDGAETVENADDSVNESTNEVDLAADIEAIFAGTDLSEEFKAKALRVYEASVIAMATGIAADAEAQLTEAFNAELAAIQEQTEQEVAALTENINEDVEKYLEYVSNNWLTENKIEATSIVKTHIAESFMTEMAAVLERHNIDLPDEKIDLYSELEEKYAALEATNNKLLEEAISLKAEKDEAIREGIVYDFTDGLSDFEKDKFIRLSEAIEFEDDDSYKGKLSEIRESYFPQKIEEKIEQELDSEELVTLEEEVVTKPSNSVRSMPGFREIAKASPTR